VFAKEFKSFLGDPLGSQVNLLGEEQEEPPWAWVAYTRSVGDSRRKWWARGQQPQCDDE